MMFGHQFVTDSVLRTADQRTPTALDDDARKTTPIETVSARYRFIGIPSAIPAAPGVQPLRFGFAATCLCFIGRVEPLARRAGAWTSQRQARGLSDCRRTGYRQTTRSSEHCKPATSLVHGQCVEHFGTAIPFSCFEALEELCCSDSDAVLAARRGADLVGAGAAAQHGGGARSAATRAAGATRRMLREWANPDRYTEPPAVAGDRDSALSDRAI
jgi:hypothetical protein